MASLRPTRSAYRHQDAYDWYEEHQPGLGEEFLKSVTDSLELVEKSPEVFQIAYLNFRKALTNRFPYRVFYEIDKSTVIVARILHSARDHTREL